MAVESFDLAGDEDVPARGARRIDVVDFERDRLAAAERTEWEVVPVQKTTVCPSVTWSTEKVSGRPCRTRATRPRGA
jgi:hypothetical protein